MFTGIIQAVGKVVHENMKPKDAYDLLQTMKAEAGKKPATKAKKK